MSKIGKRAILLLLALPIGFNVMAQETKKPTLEELIPGGESYRYAENLYRLQWWGDECIKPGVDTLYSIQPKTGKETMVITREQINKVLEENKAGKLSHLYSVRFPWTDKAQMLFTIAGKFIVYDFKNNQVISTFKPKDGANNEDYCAASGNVAYTIDNNLYVNEKAVTNEPEGIVCGQTVHRNEFGINKGTFWSPKGNLLAFYRMDESMVTQYPLVDITARVGEVNNVRYPMAGMTSHQVKVGIYNPATGKSIYLNAGDPTDRYFTNISWAPDEKSLYLIEVNRDQNHAKLCQYNAETGEPMGVLYEEMHPKYVEPQNPIVFLPWDPTKFIYQSQRDGYNHLYLFETNAANMKGETYNSANGGSYFQAGKVKQLTKGNWLVSEILGFNTKRKEVIFTAVEGLRSGHFAVNVSNGKISEPFENCKESEHSGTLSASGTYLIDRYSTKDQPRVINLVDTKNFKETANLLTAENPYDGYQMPSIETGTIKAADGTTDLHYRLMKPANFDPAKKYPVIVIGDKTTDINLNVIETSNYTAGVLMAEHLYELGHRNIAFLTTTIGKSLSLAMRYQRLKAIQNTYKKLCMNEPYNIIVKEAKIDPELERKNIFLEHGVGYQLCNECLDDRNLANLTAFIGNNDMVSYGIMDAILKKGYQIPDDFSVCGFDNDFASSLLPISLTTVEHYMEDKGKKAFNMIYEKIQEKDDFFVQDDKCVIRIEYKSKLISRDSTNVARTRKNINL